MLVELKNGETLNGHLVSCDTYMNLTLREVVQTSPEGDRFYRLPEAYVRGNNVGFFFRRPPPAARRPPSPGPARCFAASEGMGGSLGIG
jgi:small nuclear ribonucleoprotein (snRNP)-like protein